MNGKRADGNKIRFCFLWNHFTRDSVVTVNVSFTDVKNDIVLLMKTSVFFA